MSSLKIIPEQLLLRTATDWFDWINFIKSKALQAEVWELIDPDKETIQQPERPKRLTLQDVPVAENAPPATYKDLTTEQERFLSNTLRLKRSTTAR